MNLHLLQRLHQGDLPKTLADPAEIRDAMQLEQAGYIEAKFQLHSKGRDTYGELRPAVVMSITQLGLQALEQAAAG